MAPLARACGAHFVQIKSIDRVKSFVGIKVIPALVQQVAHFGGQGDLHAGQQLQADALVLDGLVQVFHLQRHGLGQPPARAFGRGV